MSVMRIRWLEFFALYVALPLAFYVFLPLRYLLPLLLPLGLLAYVVERRRAAAASQSLWRPEAVNRANLVPMLRRFVPSAAAITLLVVLWQPELLFSFVRERPLLWALVMLLYPLVSVIAQELIYRSVFFSRFAPIFSAMPVMMIANALAFGFAHILFRNWIAPVLCVIGGWYFADTYRRHRSLALVVLEHALYGDFVFTIGLGHYFYHGAASS